MYLSVFSSSRNSTLHRVLGGRLKGTLLSLLSWFVCVCVLVCPNFDAFCSVLWIKKWVCMYMMPQVWCSYFWYIKHYLAFLYTLKLGYSYLSFFLFINAFLLLWFEATVFLSSLFLFSLVYFLCTASTFFCSMKSLVSFVTLVFPFGY